MNNSSAFSLEHLNPSQKQAVVEINGVSLVIAGAGSGKTRVITSRIANLLMNHAIPASSIVALTFTNKAAQEMKERIGHMSNNAVELPFVGTFHAYCLRLLKQNKHLLTHPFESIMDEDDQIKLIQSIIARANLQKQLTAKQVAYALSQIKNTRITQIESGIDNEQLLSIYRLYEHEKRLSKCLDFDDLLLETVALFKNNPGFRTQFQHKIRHMLVDEYQDTNVVQHELLKCIALDQNKALAIDSLCVVGDEDQSIYSWRGATIANIVEFKKDFPQARTITIEQNYRSAQPILNAANHVIINNSKRNPKKLWSTKAGQHRIKVMTCLSDYNEADTIACAIKASRTAHKNNTIAVLYRTHFQSRSIEEVLVKQGISYKMIGGVQFYERKEIKDLLAYLKLVVNPFDRTSLLRVINTPGRGLGAKFEEQLLDAWAREPLLQFQDILKLLREEQPKTKKDAIISFLTVFEGITSEMAPGKALEMIIARTKYKSYITEEYPGPESADRLANIKELSRAIDYMQQTKELKLGELLDDIALMQENYKQTQDTSGVTVLLMTLHAAKGLEFDFVILSGLEEGLLPSSRSLTDADAVEEERRLLYVGITRAREYLLITNSRYRYSFGSMNDQKPSRFLREIPNSLATTHEITQQTMGGLPLTFNHWLSGKPAQIAYTEQKKSAVPSDRSIKPAKKVVSSSQAQKAQESSEWKKHQPVQHPTFGSGLITEVEVKGSATILTIAFKGVGVKKVSAAFVNKV